MRNLQHRQARDRGVTGAEYALVVSFVSIVLVGAVAVLGSNFSDWVGNLNEQLGGLLG